MKLTENLSDFNRRLADDMRSTFAPSVKPYQSEDGTLLFRGPISGHKDPKHIGTHVAVSLDQEVIDALKKAEALEREEMIDNLLNSLSTQVKTLYSPNSIGLDTLEIVGTMPVAKG
jgi:hypothetical protein